MQDKGNMTDWNKVRREWLRTSRRGSVHTERAYKIALRDFEKVVSPTLLENAKRADVEMWANDMAERGLSEATINLRLAAVSSFYQFCQLVFGLIEVNPVAGVKRNRVPLYGQSRPLSAEQVGALLEAMDRSSVQGVRDYAMILMAIYTGRRSAEIRGLRWVDIQHAADGRVRYHWRGKGGKSQWADLPPPVYKAIQLYLEAAGRRPEMEEPIFVAHNRNGGGRRVLSSEWFNQMVKGYAEAAGLPDWVHVHTLRHTAANLRDRAGRGVQEISLLLGHSTLRVTQIYLEAQRGFRDEGWQDVERVLGIGD